MCKLEDGWICGHFGLANDVKIDRGSLGQLAQTDADRRSLLLDVKPAGPRRMLSPFPCSLEVGPWKLVDKQVPVAMLSLSCHAGRRTSKENQHSGNSLVHACKLCESWDSEAMLQTQTRDSFRSMTGLEDRIRNRQAYSVLPWRPGEIGLLFLLHELPHASGTIVWRSARSRICLLDFHRLVWFAGLGNRERAPFHDCDPDHPYRMLMHFEIGTKDHSVVRTSHERHSDHDSTDPLDLPSLHPRCTMESSWLFRIMRCNQKWYPPHRQSCVTTTAAHAEATIGQADQSVSGGPRQCCYPCRASDRLKPLSWRAWSHPSLVSGRFNGGDDPEHFEADDSRSPLGAHHLARW